jgi:hypothetical protein
MRFDSIWQLPREAQKIAQHLQADVPRFLGVKLHAGDLTALDDGRKRLAVRGDRDSIAGDRGDETVGEVHLRAVGDLIDDGILVLEIERVPADVWDFDAR